MNRFNSRNFYKQQHDMESAAAIDGSSDPHSTSRKMFRPEKDAMADNSMSGHWCHARRWHVQSWVPWMKMICPVMGAMTEDDMSSDGCHV